MEIRHRDSSNTLTWRDFIINNKKQIDISGKLVVKDDVSGYIVKGSVGFNLDISSASSTALPNNLLGISTTGASDGGMVFAIGSANNINDATERIRLIDSNDGFNGHMYISTRVNLGYTGDLDTYQGLIAHSSHIGVVAFIQEVLKQTF